MTRLILLSVVAMLAFCDASGQQLHRRTQFLFNTYLINPAVAGTQVYTPILASYRQQWAGFAQAPTTYTISGHTLMPNKIGLGGIIFQDNTGGAISRTGAEVTGSYHVDLNNQDAVSFGLSLVGSQFKFDNSSLVVYDENDLALVGDMESQFNVDANVGMMVYGSNYFFGFSFPQLLQAKLKLESGASPDQNKNARHYYFMGAYKYYITNEIDIQPSALIKFTGASPVQFDVNAKVTFQELIWAGLTYRHKDAVALNVGAFYQGFSLGYAYDLTTTDARNFSPHTHEITAGYYISRKGRGFTNKSLLGPKVISRRRVIK